MVLQKKRLIGMLIIIGSLLMIPLIAMQFTEEVKWTLGDFLIMGGILLLIGLVYEFIAQRAEKTVYKAAFALGLLGAFLLFWVNGAVGIIGSENQDANLLYGIVFLVGIVGAIISRFKAKGMSTTLFITATVQMLIPFIDFLFFAPPEVSWSPGVFRVFLLSSFFAGLFFLSGLLFKKAVES